MRPERRCRDGRQAGRYTTAPPALPPACRSSTRRQIRSTQSSTSVHWILCSPQASYAAQTALFPVSRFPQLMTVDGKRLPGNTSPTKHRAHYSIRKRARAHLPRSWPETSWRPWPAKPTRRTGPRTLARRPRHREPSEPGPASPLAACLPGPTASRWLGLADPGPAHAPAWATSSRCGRPVVPGDGPR